MKAGRHRYWSWRTKRNSS